MSETIELDEIVDAFKDSVGEGKAEEFVTTAARNAGIGEKRQYETEEAIEIADEISDLDDASAFVRTSASTLKTRIRVGNL